jgi:hypothetical protein
MAALALIGDDAAQLRIEPDVPLAYARPTQVNA